MKLNRVFVKREIVGETILVPTAQAAGEYNGVIALNEVGGFLYDHLEEAAGLEDLVKLVVAEFDVDEATARADTEVFLNKLKEQGVLL